MKSISLKLQEELLKTIERCARALGISRAEYIRREIERINRGGCYLRRAFMRSGLRLLRPNGQTLLHKGGTVVESTEPLSAHGHSGNDARWVSWEPGNDTLIAATSLVALWGTFLLCTWLRRDRFLFSFFAVYAVTAIAAVLLPAFYVMLVRGEAPSHLGVTTRRCWTALLISGLLGAVLFPGLRAELSKHSGATLAPQLLYNGLLLWEPFFVFGWLQLRFERAFGIIPSIMFTALTVMIYHVGSLPAQYLPSMVVFGVFNCSVFRLTGNLLTIWPVYFAVASAIGTLQGNIVASGSWVGVMAIVLLIQIAGFVATIRGRR